MPSAPIKKPMISVQLPEKNRRQPARPQQSIPKKMPHSQKPSVATPNETSDTLDDLSFLRLPEVKAVTGLSKTSIYDLIREKKFSCTRPAGTARSCLGQVRNQTVGRTARARVAIGCLMRSGDFLRFGATAGPANRSARMPIVPCRPLASCASR